MLPNYHNHVPTTDDLFTKPEIPYIPGSSTSIKAARKQIVKSEGDKEKVLKALRDNPEGLTDWEGSELTGLMESTYRARRIGLRDSWLVVDSGRVRSNHIHGDSTVWIALEYQAEGHTTAQVASMLGCTNAEAFGVLVNLMTFDDLRWRRK